jgi:HAD superfamily hydrolase (TIGR01450 family)
MRAPDPKAGDACAQADLQPTGSDLGLPGQAQGRFLDWLDAHPQALDALVLDIDGVLLLARRATPGSRELLARLRADHLPFLLLTNDGDHSPQEKAAILRDCGLEIQAEEIVSCANGLSQIAGEIGPNGAPFFIMGNLGLPCYAETAGLQTTRDLNLLHDCQGVIVGENDYDWESTINAVVNYFIQHPDALLVTPNPDEYYPDGRGGVRLAAGSVSRLIQRALASYGCPKAPLYLGKPHAPIFHMAHQRLEQMAGKTVERGRVMMIGDNLDADVAGAAAFGYRTAVVLTGITTATMLAAASQKPDGAWHGL